MTTNTTYRSVFSGQDIDEAIAAMKNSVNGIVIASDFATGGIEKAAAAELTKILHEQVEQIKDPDFLQTLLDQTTDYAKFTDADRIKMDRLTLDFRGGFLNAAARDAFIGSDIVNYVGRELTILFDNGTGAVEFSRWDALNSKWVRINLNAEFDPALIASASASTLFYFDATKFSTMKCVVSVGNATQRHVQELMVVSIGTDVYLSVYGEVGNATLFNASVNRVGNTVNLQITTLLPNLTMTGNRTCLI